jgi:hypothetical protein
MAKMDDQITKESRDFLEAECLRVAKKIPGCEQLEKIEIARSEKGTGKWHVSKFDPELSHDLKTAARTTILKQLQSRYALMGD